MGFTRGGIRDRRRLLALKAKVQSSAYGRNKKAILEKHHDTLLGLLSREGIDSTR
jgi:hypothetical protein